MDFTVENVSQTGFKVGLGIAIIPVAATSLIACSQIIFVNVIANVALYILTLGSYYIAIPAAIIAVPLLWKISLVAVGVGAIICVASLTTNLINHYYQKHLREKAAAATENG